jgi:hypothetical protein
MVSRTLRQEIEDQLEHLPPDLQRRVLDFARALVLSQPRGIAGNRLLRFAGSLADEDADAILKAIEQGCEQVNLDEW